MIAFLFVEKSNVALANNDGHKSLYVASYIPGPWSQSNNSATEGTTQGSIVLVNSASNSLNNLNMTLQVDGSEIINPTLRLWDSNYTLNTPNSFFQSLNLFEDIQNYSTPVTSINIEPNQKETISLSIPSMETFQFSSHTLTIYITQRSFGDIINGSSLTIPQTETYLQIVRYSPVESDEGTYHQYYNSTLKSNMVTVAYNPNFYQRYHNISKHDYYSDTFGIMHYMGSLDYSYFNVSVFNNNTFPVNSVALFGQIPSRGSYGNRWGALIDHVMQPNETYIFPVSEAELPSYAYATGYIANNSGTASPTPSPTVPEFSWLVIAPLLLSLFSIAIIVRDRKTTNLSK